MRTWTMVWAAFAACVTAACMAAGQDSTFTYQGELVESGQPADGNFDIRLRLFDAATGGTLLASDTVANVLVTDGIFSVEADFGLEPTLTEGDLWVEISVRPAGGGSFSMLSPRQRINSTPRSTSALGATETFRLFDSGVLGARFQPTVPLFGDVEGTELELFDETGSRYMALQPDFDGEGGFLTIESADGEMFFDGSSFGGGPRLSLDGPSSAFGLDTNATGDAAVSFPAGAVSASEILNEPGVANNQTSPVVLSTTTSTLLSRTINAPGPGFAVVIGSTDVRQFPDGTNASAEIGLSEAPDSLGSGTTDWSFNLPSGLPSGLYQQIGTGHAVFEIPAAGNYTYYLNGRGTDGAIAFDVQLTVLYVPTAYGPVVSNLENASVVDDPSDARGPLTPEEIEAEQEAARAWSEARRAQEIAEIKALQAEFNGLQNELNGIQAELNARINRLNGADAANAEEGNTR